jgi:LmbE family N-acetylglucosaminyl deacetylase
MHSIMVVGGHSGDEIVMAGGLLCKCASRGDKIHLVSITQGCGGHPTLPRSEYRKQKESEALACAKLLGATTYFFPYPSRESEISLEAQKILANEIRKHRPDVVITHWKGSVHRDHASAYFNTVYALGLAADLNFKTEYEPFAAANLYFAENWEDPENYSPDIYVSLSQQDVDDWLKCCECFQFFRESFYEFDYKRYYLSLFACRGQLCGKNLPYACTFMRPAGLARGMTSASDIKLNDGPHQWLPGLEP